MLPGETVSTGAKHPGTELKVLQSGGGFYIGFLDSDGLPYSRESHYYPSREDAETALKNGNINWR